MIDFKEGNGIYPGTWTGSGMGSGMGSGIFADIRPARTRPTALPCRPAEHAPTPTHPHTPAHVDAIDFNTPRLSSFGEKKTFGGELRLGRPSRQRRAPGAPWGLPTPDLGSTLGQPSVNVRYLPEPSRADFR